MMQIKNYIRTQVFQPRLNKAGCLVIYDPDRRHRELSRDLTSEAVTVVDASESSIESCEAASRALREVFSCETPYGGNDPSSGCRGKTYL